MVRLKPHEIDDIFRELYGHFAAQLTEWESDFIGSLQQQWQRTQHLSDKQDAKLQEIWEEFATGRRRRALGVAPDDE